MGFDEFDENVEDYTDVFAAPDDREREFEREFELDYNERFKDVFDDEGYKMVRGIILNDPEYVLSKLKYDCAYSGSYNGPMSDNMIRNVEDRLKNDPDSMTCIKVWADWEVKYIKYILKNYSSFEKPLTICDDECIEDVFGDDWYDESVVLDARPTYLKSYDEGVGFYILVDKVEVKSMHKCFYKRRIWLKQIEEMDDTVGSVTIVKEDEEDMED